MRLRISVCLALGLLPAAAQAGDPVIAIDCLCVADEQGWVRGRSDATTTEAGLDSLTTGESFIVLRAAADQCAKHPDGCGDDRFTPISGDRRARLDGIEYMGFADGFKLTVDGVAAPPAGDAPLIEVDCLCTLPGTGSITGLSDDPPGRLGLPALTPRETVVRFRGRAQGCTKHAAACMEPMTEAADELRATLLYYNYPQAEGEYQLRIEGELAAP